MSVPISGSAAFSPCGRYRYLLRRTWDQERAGVLFVMLNPSTADGVRDDPTIRRCVGFARSWGYGSLTVANLFAFISTNPGALMLYPERVGPENDTALRVARHTANTIVVAWGAQGVHWPQRAAEVVALLRGERLDRRALFCLGTTAADQPCHPLRLSRQTVLRRFA